MKQDIEIYTENQVWLLTDGRLAFIRSLAPRTKLHATPKDRGISLFIAKPYNKKDLFKSGSSVVIEDDFYNTSFVIDVSSQVNSTLDKFMRIAYAYRGTLNEEALKRIYREVDSDY